MTRHSAPIDSVTDGFSGRLCPRVGRPPRRGPTAPCIWTGS